ncbi:arylamine N-acetyltransferase [Hymenobacter sp.]|uniref:arylamine N-acetyltransferase family protein n=1 Tax=Hymenobacter sp. TaxID=1898978 RepID=UPI00286BC301|nr:arylamine N-acetyltransferase [Hymenobacter sp.]
MPSSAVDLAAYTARIGYHGPLAHSLETLVGLHRAQAFSIPFENLDLHRNRPIALDPASLQRKLVAEERGGYCYELNGLFRLVLLELGFSVTGLVGRNLIAGHPLRPRAHQVLRVEAAGHSWLADLGFGTNGLIEPIPLVADAESHQFFDHYRLRAAPHHNYHLQLQIGGEWQSLYTFTLDEAQPSDYQMMNFFYSQSPDSPFRKQRICTRAAPDFRVSLVDRELKIRRADGITTAQLLTDAAYEQALATYFGIRLPVAAI